MSRRKKHIFVLVVFVLIVLIAIMTGIYMHRVRSAASKAAPLSALSHDTDSSRAGKQFAAAAANSDTASLSMTRKERSGVPAHKKQRELPAATGAAPAVNADSQAPAAVSLSREEAQPDTDTAGSCVSDTTAPWVYTDPSGGLHHEAISVKLFATKPSAIEWKTDGEGPWNAYNGQEIRIAKTTTLFLRAKDSCGNMMQDREEQYEIKAEETDRFCPKDMEHVLVGATSFCIDRYEWPNMKGRLPRAYVSVYQAMDTCASVGKRLCTSDEWTIACTGPYGWKYPYGAQYEIYACNTNDTSARPSGSRSECRGYFGVFDMSGNCAEWTSTKSSSNTRFYNVMGGFWESGPQSGCFDVRYSYFPQNRHNPVGFRCCKDASSDKIHNGAE